MRAVKSCGLENGKNKQKDAEALLPPSPQCLHDQHVMAVWLYSSDKGCQVCEIKSQMAIKPAQKPARHKHLPFLNYVLLLLIKKD